MERLDPLVLVAIVKAISAKMRDEADAYMGPGKTYPVYKDGRQLAAAWDLAGKASDPDQIRHNILAFAHEHGLMDHLPHSAREWEQTHAKKGGDGDPDDARLTQLFQMAYQHEVSEGDTTQERALAAWAEANGLARMLLPPTAQKAEEPELVVAKSIQIAKAWTTPEGTVIEGWVSTEDRDIEKDVVPPEAFKAALPGYLARRAPLSSEHNMRDYPVGHGQRIALVRDGQILAQGTHPSDPADFEHFPGLGTGVYGRYLVTEAKAADAVAKGNVGGFSWVGTIKSYDRLPDGGRRFTEIGIWRESTIAAYPINSKAVVVAAN